MSKMKKENKTSASNDSLEDAVTETPVIDEPQIPLNEQIDQDEKNKELENKNKTLEAELNKIKTQQKQLMLATKLNTIKELEIQNKENTKYANQKIIKEIIPTLLNFQRALNIKITDEKVENFLIGFKYIAKELLKTLENEGLKEITAKVGDKFDPHQHDPVEKITINPGNKEIANNTIVEVISNGYSLHHRVIKTIQVKVFIIPNKKEQNSKTNDKLEPNKN